MKGSDYDVHQTWGEWLYLRCVIWPVWTVAVVLGLAWDWLKSKASGGRIPGRW